MKNKQDTVLILASVGTNIIRAKESTYDVIQKELAEYSGLTVYQVFTDDSMQCGPEIARITSEYLDYDEVVHKFDIMLDWLAGLYVNILNLIQYMHMRKMKKTLRTGKMNVLPSSGPFSFLIRNGKAFLTQKSATFLTQSQPPSRLRNQLLFCQQ